MIGLPPLLYLCFNSAACLVFAAAPRETCGTRIEANYALTMTLVFSNLLPVLLVFEPISPQQIMRLEGLAWHHFVAAAFGAVSFVCVITLASTHERFEPVTSFLYYTARASYALAFVGVVVFGAGVVNLSSRPSFGAAHADASWMRKRVAVKREALVPSRLLPWRAVLHGITLAYLATCWMPSFNAVLTVPSIASASYHFFLVKDDTKWALAHFACHWIGDVIEGSCALSRGDLASASIVLVYLVIVHPLVLKGIIELRRVMSSTAPRWPSAQAGGHVSRSVDVRAAEHPAALGGFDEFATCLHQATTRGAAVERPPSGRAASSSRAFFVFCPRLGLKTTEARPATRNPKPEQIAYMMVPRRLR